MRAMLVMYGVQVLSSTPCSMVPFLSRQVIWRNCRDKFAKVQQVSRMKFHQRAF